jgi:MFS family permease
MFAYGSCSLILALFFAELHVSDEQIGLFMTLTQVGDVVLSLLLTLVADNIGRRRTLFAGAALMVVSGTVFALFENYWLLLAAAVVGVISATGGDFGPFRAIEESTISELTDQRTRPDVLVWYVTMSTLGSALGTGTAGRVVQWFHESRGWPLLDAYHACFWLYAVMGGVTMLSSLLLSNKCELQQESRPSVDTEMEMEEEGEAFLGEADDSTPKETPRKSIFAQISKQTRSIMYALWFLLMVDSLADGMVSMPLTTYYMDRKFSVAKSALGDIVSVGYFLAFLSTIFAGPLSRHIGLVNTMVFTHIPSSAAVLIFPYPQSVAATFALLLIRMGLNNMDQPPRTALIAAVVKPEERTAVMGITGTLRTVASTAGPTVTGFLAGDDRFWIAFVVAGALRLAYDLGLFAMFINIELQHRHKPAPHQGTEEQVRASDDEHAPG